jgi:hypothetical protein
MKKNKIEIADATRGRNVNIINMKTCNTKHETYNTTNAAKAAHEKLLDETSSLPLAEEKKNVVGAPDLATLEAEVVHNRQQREQAHLDSAAVKKFVDEKADLRKKMQAGKERDAKSIIEADYIHRIEVSVHKKSHTASVYLNIDVLEEPGYFQKFKAICQNRRARDIMQSVPPKYRDWPGYEYAKEAIRDGANAGKICLRQSAQGKTQIASKTIPKAIAVFNPDTMEVEILLGNKTYIVSMAPYTSEYYVMKGILQNEKEEEWMDI